MFFIIKKGNLNKNCRGKYDLPLLVNTVLMRGPKEGTFEKRLNETRCLVETIKPRKINRTLALFDRL